MTKFTAEIWLNRAMMKVHFEADDFSQAKAMIKAFFPAADDMYIYPRDK